MAQYLSYEQYTKYGGALSESAFVLPKKRAEREIDCQTMGRIRYEFDGTQSYCEDLACLTCGLIEQIIKDDACLTSESCDGVSASYKAKTQAEQRANRARLIGVMLEGYKDKNGVLLLYTGCGS